MLVFELTCSAYICCSVWMTYCSSLQILQWMLKVLVMSAGCSSLLIWHFGTNDLEALFIFYFFGSQHWQDTLFFLFPDLLTVSASLTFKSMAIAIMVHHTMHLALRGVPKGRWRNHFWGMIVYVSMFLCWIDKKAKNILCAVVTVF